MTAKDDIRNYLTVKIMPEIFADKPEDANKPITHMLMVCDTFSYEHYPVYVAEGQDIHQLIKHCNKEVGYSKVMEVYSYKREFDSQLNERRAWHPDSQKYTDYQI